MLPETGICLVYTSLVYTSLFPLLFLQLRPKFALANSQASNPLDRGSTTNSTQKINDTTILRSTILSVNCLPNSSYNYLQKIYMF